MNPLTLKFIESHPGEAAAVLEQTEGADGAELIATLPPELAAGLLARLLPGAAVECLRALAAARAAALLRLLPVDFAAALLGRLKPDERQTILAKLPQGAALPLKLMLRRRPTTVGAIADPEVLTVRAEMRAGDVMRLARKRPHQLRQYLYVLDEQQRLIATVDARTCLLAKRETAIEALMKADPVALRARMSLGEVRQHPAWTRFGLLPVVDRRDHFLGIVRRATLLHASAPDSVPMPGAGFGETLLSLADLYWRGSAALFTPAMARVGEGEK